MDADNLLPLGFYEQIALVVSTSGFTGKRTIGNSKLD